jgi:adenylate cyclase class 2
MIEVEMKFKVENHTAVREKLTDIGAFNPSYEATEDIYFDLRGTFLGKPSPSTLGINGRTLRVRKHTDYYGAGAVTLKGSRLNGIDREETEVLLESPEAADTMCMLLIRSSFYIWAIVKKRRNTYRWMEMSICLDDVEGFGCFVEIEKVVREKDVGDAEKQISDMARALGLDPVDKIDLSYPQIANLLAKWCEPFKGIGEGL